MVEGVEWRKKPPRGMNGFTHQSGKRMLARGNSAADPDAGLKKERTKDKTQYGSWSAKEVVISGKASRSG